MHRARSLRSLAALRLCPARPGAPCAGQRSWSAGPGAALSRGGAAKQALVHVSHLMSTGRFHRLKGLVSDEMMEYVETRTKALTRAQKLQLPVHTEDIVFLLPEDVTVVYDQYGRKFCTIVMRFWFVTELEGPEDPEATRVFRVAPSQDGRPQIKVATAVYEFRRELTRGASPDWTVITVWHWHWTLAPEAPD